MTMTSSSPLMGQIDQNQIEANGEVPQEVEITIKELSVSRKIPILDHLLLYTGYLYHLLSFITVSFSHLVILTSILHPPTYSYLLFL